MDHPNSRNAINDPNQCRLCMRVCDDSFLEYIFTEKEYSLAHQIFECTSIRVTKQDNLTKICKNCASLLFLTTEFRNACFKTNRLLMEDFVILELGDWAADSNQLLLRECENFIVRHKQQVDYLYASIVTNSEQYLEGSLAIDTDLFGDDGQQQRMEKKHGIERATLLDAKPVPARLEQCEPDPEILMEITKFLEEQTPSHQHNLPDHTQHVQDHSKQATELHRCSLCCVVSDTVFGLTNQQQKIVRVLNFEHSKLNKLRSCNECCLLLDVIDSFQKILYNAQELSLHERSSCETSQFESMVELEKCLMEKLKHKQEVFVKLQNKMPKTQTAGLTSNQTEPVVPIKKSSKRTKVTCHICGKQYDNWKLKTHLNEHENIRPYACDQEGCSSTFTGLVLLNRHKKLWHTDYYYAVCSVCGKKCKTQGIYKTHLSYHEEPKLPCTVCGKLMRNKRAIWKHMKTHSNDRKHVCGVCNKKFTIAYTLRVHMRIHTNDKPYPCAKCDKRFQYKCLLKNHCQRYHSEGDSK
uniref:Protein krueppel n=1 Tax=Anopheles funestus TaxID=62324 RepID=A0A182RHK1_ANOFN